uniref:hypothetical protein n=1 Tax=Roseovarius indicus TaxID=540747 RepID=UPI003B522FF5
MKKTILTPQLAVETHNDEMSKETRVIATIPANGRFDIEFLSSTLAELSAMKEADRPTQLDEVKRLVEFDKWTEATSFFPKQKDAQGPVQVPPPFSQEHFHFRISAKVQKLERLRLEHSQSHDEQILDQVIALSISVGRLLEEMALRKLVFPYVSTGKKIRAGLDEGRERGNASVREKSRPRLDFMQGLIECGHSVTNAARIAAFQFGGTLEANKKLYNRRKKAGTFG